MTTTNTNTVRAFVVTDDSYCPTEAAFASVEDFAAFVVGMGWDLPSAPYRCGEWRNVDPSVLPVGEFTRPFQADDGNCEVTIQAKTAAEAAEIYVADGDYPDEDTTHWISVQVWSGIDEDGDRIDADWHKVAVEPTEPECTEGEHDWQSPHALVGGLSDNPGVFGDGGGVRWIEVCVCCGAGRYGGNWGTDRVDGEQGMDWTGYERPGTFEIDRLDSDA